MTPGSAVSVIRSETFSSLATAATPSGMPMPRLTTLLASSSSAARRAMTFRSLSSIGGTDPARNRISPLNAGSYCTEKVCQWCSGRATTTQSTKMPGILTCRGLSDPRSAIRSTCAITTPPELRAAIAIASTSSVSASFSMVILPSGSAVVPRTMPTLIGKAR